LICAALLALATLPGTTAWEFPADIAAEQYAEMRGWYERAIARAREQRRPFTDAESGRREIREKLGIRDEFLTPKPEFEPVGDFGSFTASIVSWPILRAGTYGPTVGSAGMLVREYGVLLTPKGSGNRPAVVVIADADRSASDISGITGTLPAAERYGLELAKQGYVVFAPFFTQRRTFSQPWLDDRRWLFRLGYQTGRHLTGLEVQQVLAARDLLAGLPSVDAERIAVAGHGQGGMTALYAGALEPRFRAVVVSGYFDTHPAIFNEPEERTIWAQAHSFGDAEVGALIARGRLIVSGAPGEELARMPKGHARSVRTISDAFDELRNSLQPAAIPEPTQNPQSNAERAYSISNSQLNQWQVRLRNSAIEAFASREKAWSGAFEVASPEAVAEWSRPRREAWLDVIGRYPAASGPVIARSVAVYDEPEFTGYRLSVHVYEGVHAYGILLVPKGMKAGERRPVVFTQHGLGGRPEHALGVVPDEAADKVYSRFGRDLARRGYIVFAPMISTQTSVDRDQLTRRAHLLGMTPLGFEVRKFSRVLDYLETLPFVDPERFGFYGLSYGGYTALWTAPAEPRFKVVISSGHFNDWSTKTTDVTLGTSFLFYPNNFDMFNWDLLTRFSHSEIAMLTAPRAFMIEVGDQDGVVVAPRRLADAEMERVLRFYKSVGLSERARVARFDGPHKIHGVEAFEFLDRWLRR
jgi:dienelactone hydrolase